MDNELLSLQEKLTIISAENIVKRIKNKYYELTGTTLSREYILENYEIEAKRFNIQITKEEKNVLTKMFIVSKTQLTDFHIKRLLQEKTTVENDFPSAVILVDFKNRKVIPRY